MGSLTKQEKIDLATKQVEQSRRSLDYYRRQVQETLATIEMHEEYLEALTAVNDLDSRDPKSPLTHTRSAKGTQ